MTAFRNFGARVEDELNGLGGDPRVERRGRSMLERWQENPGVGFPEIFGNDSELEAAYRFFKNQNLDFDTLLRPHVANTVERAKRFDGDVLCIHDSTAFVFSGQRRDLGFVNKNNSGFLGHFTLVATRAPDGTPVPLGVAACSTWVRTETRGSKGVPQHKLRESKDCESLRWLKGVREAEERLGSALSQIHVMDREGDIYDSVSTMVSEGIRFVSRAQANRTIESDDDEYHLLFDALDGLPVRYRDTVTVSARKASKFPDQRKTYPAREGREAEVCVAATTVTVKRTRHSSKEFPPRTTLNVVHVFEPNAPEGSESIEWILLTNEPISTEKELRRIVAIYRQRWLIEELFKAIKTGCIFEKRQFESYRRLLNVLALTIPVAWSMLLLRAQSRAEESMPAETFIDPFRLQVLAAHAQRNKLPDSPTVRDVALAIAGLGGFLKRNGTPGWQTLRRGYAKLLTFEEGWIASRETCEQS
jgi:hypothetical protein